MSSRRSALGSNADASSLWSVIDAATKGSSWSPGLKSFYELDPETDITSLIPASVTSNGERRGLPQTASYAAVAGPPSAAANGRGVGSMELRFRKNLEDHEASIAKYSLQEVLVLTHSRRKLDEAFEAYGIADFQEQLRVGGMTTDELLQRLQVPEPELAWMRYKFMSPGQVIYLSADCTPRQSRLKTGQVIRVRKNLQHVSSASGPAVTRLLEDRTRLKWVVSLTRDPKDKTAGAGQEYPDCLEIIDALRPCMTMGTKLFHEGRILGAVMWFTKGIELSYAVKEEPCLPLKDFLLFSRAVALAERCDLYARLASLLDGRRFTGLLLWRALWDIMESLRTCGTWPSAYVRASNIMGALGFVQSSKTVLLQGLLLCKEKERLNEHLESWKDEYGGKLSLQRFSASLEWQELEKGLCQRKAEFADEWGWLRDVQGDLPEQVEGLAKAGFVDALDAATWSRDKHELRDIPSVNADVCLLLQRAPQKWSQSRLSVRRRENETQRDTAADEALGQQGTSDDLLKLAVKCSLKGRRDVQANRVFDATFWSALGQRLLTNGSGFFPIGEGSITKWFQTLSSETTSGFKDLSCYTSDEERTQDICCWRVYDLAMLSTVGQGALARIDAYVDMAAALQMMGKIEEASATLHHALRNDPRDSRINGRLRDIKREFPLIAKTFKPSKIDLLVEKCQSEWWCRRWGGQWPDLAWFTLRENIAYLTHLDAEVAAASRIRMLPCT